MSGNRKRRSSDSLEGDRKRISFDRKDCVSFKEKHNYNGSLGSNGRQSYCAVPYDYIAPATVGIQSAIVSNKSHRYFYRQNVEPNNFDDRKRVDSSIRNNDSGYYDALAAYDERRRMNFKHEIYIDSLRQSEPRLVNFDVLRRRLSDIDIRYIYNWNFSTALDLTIELESSLKYFVDTRNELVFLRKMLHSQCIPFSYNEINISNRSGLHNRMRFLDAESAYRSNRMNQLFYRLQTVVIPSIIDDIRYFHSISYENCWTDRARYWFTLFKQIKWEHGLSTRNSGDRRYQPSLKHRRSNRNYYIKDEVGFTRNVNIKSETVVKTSSFDAKSVKIEKTTIESKDSTLHKQDPTGESVDKRVDTMSTIVEPAIASSDGCNNNKNSMVELGKNLEDAETASTQENAVETENNDNVGAEISDLSSSIVIIEPNVSVVTVADDDDDHQRDLSNINAIPPAGDTSN